MKDYAGFKQHVKDVAQKFKDLNIDDTIRVVSHFDADGISSCALMIGCLNKINKRYSMSIVKQLTNEILKALANEPYQYFIFTDLGCGQIKFIKEALPGKTIFILDHHIPEEVEIPENITIVNPHYYGIDGSQEISGGGVTYLFAQAVEPSMDEYAHIAIIGAIGDVQDKKGFLPLNKEILQTAVAKGKIKHITGLRMFGAQTRALYKALEYSSDPYIPGVTGSESGAIQFLQQIGVPPKDGNKWRKIVHLSEDEKKKLIGGIIMKRFNEPNPEDVLSSVYILREEKKESPLRDAKEFSTLLNACGRMGKASLGIGACLGDPATKAKALSNLAGYKRKIMDAINWYREGPEENITKGEGYIIINAGDRIMATIIGTLASIVSKSNDVKPGTYLLAIATTDEGYSKASLRIAGHKIPENVDLREILKVITEKVGDCEAGGHTFAAGATFPADKTELFVKVAKEELSKKSMEEVIN